MKQVYLWAILAFSTTSCVTVQPRIFDNQDPFTGVRTRTMSVGQSDQSILLEALAAQSNNYRPIKVSLINDFLDLTLSSTDTTMTFIRIAPERAYDVPTEGLLQIRFRDTNRGDGSIISLPVVRNYHTTAGILRVTARVNRASMLLLQKEPVDIIRIDKVSANESQFLPVDWYVYKEYGNAFQKGAVMLFQSKPGTKTRR